ncbi:hypothetical protein yc1106_02803 [Curvularia clavata]|uniref:Uncharacterized protein n=1 Tax=Curvularia clavata TaxID=95742 RepID=A0A9Q8Z620_CURCL|nr:hypothetical protein yc1106_02803 [Curvularia clavata]
MRYGRYAGTFSRTKSKTPGPWQYRHLQTNSKGQREFSTAPPELDIPPSQGLSKTSEAMGHNQKDMTLLDIDDFELRSKVAQLMAVAPALPIIELYHLVIDSEGCMAQAKKRARATSKAPYAAHTFTPSTFGHSRNIVEGDKNDEDGYSEDVVVKVDPSNLAFEWDDDDPASRSAPTLKARPRSNLGNKATDSSLLPLLKKPKPTKTSETSSRSTAKRLKVSSSQRLSTRETSSDRDFIVADNVMEVTYLNFYIANIIVTSAFYTHAQSGKVVLLDYQALPARGFALDLSAVAHYPIKDAISPSPLCGGSEVAPEKAGWANHGWSPFRELFPSNEEDGNKGEENEGSEGEKHPLADDSRESFKASNVTSKQWRTSSLT